MTTASRMTMAAFFSIVSIAAYPATVYECVAANGDRTFEKHCPPGSSATGQKRVPDAPRKKSNVDLAAIARDNPVSLYSVPDCDACDLIRSELNQRGIAFQEHNITEATDLPDAVTNDSGEVALPTTTVGEQVLTGYSKSALEGALARAGYPNPSTAAYAPTATVSNAPSITTNSKIVHKCLDVVGEMTFSYACPPGTTSSGQTRLKGTSMDDGKAKAVTLYSVEDCDTCDLVRNQLNRRGIPFNERNVRREVDVPEAVKNEAGTVPVPTVTVGAQVVVGYNQGCAQ